MLYGDCEIESPEDFVLSIAPSSLARRLIKKSVVFSCDQHTPFKPLPHSQAFPLLEWGMNWCIAAHNYNYLSVHSAVLVRDGKAILFPALPGSGKSTLTAYLGLKGWQVFSDELAIIDPLTLEVQPLYRPACIKNDSIELVRQWYPSAVMTPVCHDTSKGSVAHVKLHSWQDYKSYKPAKIVGLVFPGYRRDQTLQIQQLSQLQAFQAFCTHSFNYHVLGQLGFDTVRQLISKLKMFEATYADLAFLEDFLIHEVIR